MVLEQKYLLVSGKVWWNSSKSHFKVDCLVGNLDFSWTHLGFFWWKLVLINNPIEAPANVLPNLLAFQRQSILDTWIHAVGRISQTCEYHPAGQPEDHVKAPPREVKHLLQPYLLNRLLFHQRPSPTLQILDFFSKAETLAFGCGGLASYFFQLTIREANDPGRVKEPQRWFQARDQVMIRRLHADIINEPPASNLVVTFQDVMDILKGMSWGPYVVLPLKVFKPNHFLRCPVGWWTETRGLSVDSLFFPLLLQSSIPAVWDLVVSFLHLWFLSACLGRVSPILQILIQVMIQSHRGTGSFDIMKKVGRADSPMVFLDQFTHHKRYDLRWQLLFPARGQ